jgi:hypothetical protein
MSLSLGHQDCAGTGMIIVSAVKSEPITVDEVVESIGDKVKCKECIQ